MDTKRMFGAEFSDSCLNHTDVQIAAYLNCLAWCRSAWIRDGL